MNVVLQVNYKEAGRISLAESRVKVEGGASADTEQEAHDSLAEGGPISKMHRLSSNGVLSAALLGASE